MLLELLESRLHLSSVDGEVTIVGTSADDVVKVRAEGDLAGASVWAVVNGNKEILGSHPSGTLPHRIMVKTAGGRDTIVINLHIISATIKVIVSAGPGDDHVLFRGYQRAVISGDGGNDTLVAHKHASVPVVLKGDEGNDSLKGGRAHDTLVGGGGDDELNGGAGDDVLKGGSGIDRFFGGSGNDTLYVSKNEKYDPGKGKDTVLH